MTSTRRLLRRSGLVATALATCAVAISPASAQTIIDEWANVKAPPPPELKPVTADVKTTALLLLDFGKQNCGQRPRCAASRAERAEVRRRSAREGRMPVVHSLFGQATEADLLIRRRLASRRSDPGANKFVKTDLEKILKDKGIQTVIVTGTAAHGAVINHCEHGRATRLQGDAARGRNVIRPVRGDVHRVASRKRTRVALGRPRP